MFGGDQGDVGGIFAVVCKNELGREGKAGVMMSGFNHEVRESETAPDDMT